MGPPDQPSPSHSRPPAITDPVRRGASPGGAADRVQRGARAPFHAAHGLDMDPEDNDSVRHRARLMGKLIQRVICDMRVGARRPGLPRQRPSAGAGPWRAEHAALIFSITKDYSAACWPGALS